MKAEVISAPMVINLAIPCGLIANELISNCLKHAFPPDRKGLITVSLASVNDEYEFVIADDGVGLPETVEVAERAVARSEPREHSGKAVKGRSGSQTVARHSIPDNIQGNQAGREVRVIMNLLRNLSLAYAAGSVGGLINAVGCVGFWRARNYGGPGGEHCAGPQFRVLLYPRCVGRSLGISVPAAFL